MKQFRLYALLLLATVLVFGCSKYDDTELKNDVNDLKSRVEKLETWCNTANSQISALQGLVSALEQKDYVTDVSPIMEGAKEVGYTITFAKSSSITIKHGKDGVDGVTPVIGIAKDTDGIYYWTVKTGDADVTWMLDAEGKKIATGSGGGASPELTVAEDGGRLYWKVNGQWLLHNGKKVPATGDKGDKGDTGDTGSTGGTGGSCVFKSNGITVNEDAVTFTLADGTTSFTLPRVGSVIVGFDSYDTFYCSETANEITLVLPSTLKETDYTAIVATVTNENGTDMDIQTRAASTTESLWGVKVTKPTFSAGTLVANSAKITLTLPQDKTNYRALLKVTIIDSKGKEYSVSRIVWFKADVDTNVIDNTTGSLSGKINNPGSVKQLSVFGTMAVADFTYIKDNMQSLEVLDLSRTTITAIPTGAMAFYNNPGNGWNYTTNTTLKTIILPETLTTIGNSAFAMCQNLREINIPNSVTTLGRWMFEGCASLEEVNIPRGVTDIPASAFYGAGIKRVTIPSSVTTIGGWAFNLCNNLASITIPASVTSLGESVLKECVNLESAEILANVDILPNNFFMASPKLRNVKLSTSIHTLNSNVFCNTGLTEYTIPSHITSIKEGAFSENTKLHTVTLPTGVQTAWNVFYDCKNLKTVTIPEGVTELGAEMFRGCIALESIELPSTITSIHDRAFQGCSALISLTCKAINAPALSEHNSGGENFNFHFAGINASCVLKRPAGSDYSAWSTYFNEVKDL